MEAVLTSATTLERMGNEVKPQKALTSARWQALNRYYRLVSLLRLWLRAQVLLNVQMLRINVFKKVYKVSRLERMLKLDM